MPSESRHLPTYVQLLNKNLDEGDGKDGNQLFKRFTQGNYGVGGKYTWAMPATFSYCTHRFQERTLPKHLVSRKCSPTPKQKGATKKMNQHYATTEHEKYAAITIQSVFRGRRVRSEAEMVDEMTAAAVCMQKMLRVHHAKKEVEKLRISQKSALDWAIVKTRVSRVAMTHQDRVGARVKTRQNHAALRRPSLADTSPAALCANSSAGGMRPVATGDLSSTTQTVVPELTSPTEDKKLCSASDQARNAPKRADVDDMSEHKKWWAGNCHVKKDWCHMAIYAQRKKLLVVVRFYSSKKDGVDRKHRLIVHEHEWRTKSYGPVSTMSPENRVRLCEELCGSLTSNHEVSEAALNTVPLLFGCATEVKRDILARIVKRYFTTGECICREGDKDGGGMYFLLEGTCQVQVDGKDIVSIRPAMYRFLDKPGVSADTPGSTKATVKENSRGFFGELSLLAPPEMAKRSATVRAVTEVQLGELSRQEFSAVLAAHPTFRRNIQKKTEYLFTHRENVLHKTLVGKSPLLRNLNPVCRHTMLANVTEEQFENREYLCKQGDQGDSLFIVKKGNVEVLVDDKYVRNLSSGDMFGEQLAMATILDNGSKRKRRGRSASAVAKGHVEVLKLSMDDFQHLVDWWPDFCHEMKALKQRMYEYGFALPMFDAMPISARNMVMSSLTKCILPAGKVLFRQTVHNGDKHACSYSSGRLDLDVPVHDPATAEASMFFIHEGTVSVIVGGNEMVST
jgi:CRP-like cAMP-binding protein